MKKQQQINIKTAIRRARIFMGCLFFCHLVSCVPHRTLKLSYLDAYQIPANSRITETNFGGISGIDYHKADNSYFLVSDDRSEHNAARMYKARINLKGSEIDTVLVDSVIYFSNQSKLPFGLETVDMESIRYNPEIKALVIGDEGGKKGSPSISSFDLGGRFKNVLDIDSSYVRNIRFNKSFESLSFSQDYRYLYYATEAPLVIDGMESSFNDRGLLRIRKTDFDNGKVEKEFLYWLEKVPQKAEMNPPWQGTGSDNGLSDFITLNNQQFLTLERSGAYQKDGSFNYICKLFQVFLKKGKNMSRIRTTKKKELFDFSSLPNGRFNIEGMTFGPSLNGKRTIIFISDNNFRQNVPTMLYLFEINTTQHE